MHAIERHDGTEEHYESAGSRHLDPLWRLLRDIERLHASGWRLPRARERRTARRERPVSESRTELFHLGRMALGLTAVDAAALMGASRRTSQRWSAGRTSPDALSLHRLAVAVLPKDPKLAERIHAHAARGAAKAGLPLPPLAPPEGATPDPHAVDTILCAAADAMNLAPRAVRPGLLAALLRAKEVSMGVETMIMALRAGRRAKG